MLEQTHPDEPKRIFTKTKSMKEITKTQKTSTNENDNTPKKSILKKPNINSNLSSLGVPSTLQTNIKKYKTESLQTLSRKKKSKNYIIIKYNLNELKNQINEINTKINNEKNISINNYNSLNNEIQAKVAVIKNLAVDQKELISKLKIIKNEINNKIQKANVLILKKNGDNNKEKLLSRLITVKEKEIELANKKNEKMKKEYKRVLRIFNNNDFTKEINLRKELLELKNEISTLEQEIRKLETILAKHQYCDKHKNELLNYLSLLTNAYQFEVKKTSMEDMTINSDKESEKNNLKLESINTKSHTSKTLNIFRSPKIRRTNNILNLKQKILINNKKSHLNLLTKNSFNYINNSLNDINAENGKGCSYINHTNNSNNFKKKKKSLFNLKENFFLEKIIPNEYLKKCKERFDNIENENIILKEKINLNKIKKEKLINEKQLKLEIKEIKIRANKKEKIKLNIDIYKTKKSIDELKKKINEINKETKKYNNLINIKNKENSNIKHRMQEFKKNFKKKNRKEEKEEKEEAITNGEVNNDMSKLNKNNLKEENQKNDVNYQPK